MGKRMTKTLTDEHIKVIVSLIGTRLDYVLSVVVDNLPSISQDKNVYRPGNDLGQNIHDIVNQTIEIAEIMFCSAKDKTLKNSIREFICIIQENIAIVNVNKTKVGVNYEPKNN